MSSPDAGASRGAQRTEALPRVQERAARQAPPATAQVPSGNVAATAGPPATSASRRARLLLTRVDPWSVMKLGFLLSIALGIILVVAVLVLWSVLDGMGVFDSVNHVVNQVVATDNSSGFNLLDYASLKRTLGITTLVALVNVVLLTALSTLGAFLYNLAASLVGGLHVTLSEDV